MRLTFNRRALLYAPLLGMASAMLFARTILYAKILPVESFGLLSQALLVANTFTTFAGLGLTLLAHKVLPQYHAREQRDLFDGLIAACIAILVATSAVTALGLLATIALGLVKHWQEFGAALIYAVAQYLFVLRLIELKSELRFLGHARLSGIRAAALLGAGVIVAVLTHDVTATILAEAVATVIVSAPYWLGGRGRQLFRRVSDLRHEIRRLTQFYPAAARLLWLNGTMVVMYAVDRWFGIAFLDKHAYGIFALGLTIVLLFETVQTIVNVSAFPLLGRILARGDNRRAYRLATLATSLVLATGAIFYVPFLLLLNHLLQTYLPSYLEAHVVIKLAVVAGVFRLADFYSSLAILLDQENRLAIGSGCILAATALGLVLAGAGGVRFDPNRMMTVTVIVAASAFVLNFLIATGAHRRALAVREGRAAA